MEAPNGDDLVEINLPNDREAIVAQLLRDGAVLLENVIEPSRALRMAEIAHRQEYELQPATFGKRNVRLDRVSNAAIPPGIIQLHVDELERRLSRLFGAVTFPSDPDGLVFDDQSLQLYPHLSDGIEPHQDEKANRLLIVLVTLVGTGRFRIYSSLEELATPTFDVISRPGSVTIMVGPGFLGNDYRPLHSVDEIKGTLGVESYGRILLSLRVAPGYDCFRVKKVRG